LGVVTPAYRQFAFGERSNNNSVMTAKLYTLYSGGSRTVKGGDVVSRRAVAYYSNTDATTTQQLAGKFIQMGTIEGWNGVIAFDPDETGYLLLSNFSSDSPYTLNELQTHLGAPVFAVHTVISDSRSTATFTAEKNHSVANTLKFFIEGTGLEAIQADDDSCTIYLLNQVKGDNPLTINAAVDGELLTKRVTIGQKVLKVSIRGGELLVEEAAGFPGQEVELEPTGVRLTDGTTADGATWYGLDGRRQRQLPPHRGLYVAKKQKHLVR
jgi:hypothetical protein